MQLSIAPLAFMVTESPSKARSELPLRRNDAAISCRSFMLILSPLPPGKRNLPSRLSGSIIRPLCPIETKVLALASIL